MDINLWAVFGASVLNLIFGSIWFGPLFGKAWMRYAKIEMPAQMDAAAKRAMYRSYVLMFIGSLIMAYILAHLIAYAGAYTNTSGISAGLSAAFWAWLGFVVPTSTGMVLWEGRPWASWAINYGYYLPALLLMSIVLSLWG